MLIYCDLLFTQLKPFPTKIGAKLLNPISLFFSNKTIFDLNLQGLDMPMPFGHGADLAYAKI